MLSFFDSHNVPIIDFNLQTMQDQLILGAGTHDIAYLYAFLNNETNVKNYIQLSTQNPHAIDLLLHSLDVLKTRGNSQQLFSNILRLIYTHCSEHLNHNAKVYISQHIDLKEDELNSLTQKFNSIHFSDGVKRQKVEREPCQDDVQYRNTAENDVKKHKMDGSKSYSSAKRQRVKSPPHKREVPVENHSQQVTQQPSKRTRLRK